MSFQFLTANLHGTAAAAEAYFMERHGARQFRHEAMVDNKLSLRPTLSARLNDGCILCVEVSEKAYSNSLDTFVVECSTYGFPVKLYVVIPSADDRTFGGNLKSAKLRGVGIVEIGDSGACAYCEALSLSLFGLRRTDLDEFPKSKRDTLRQAEVTFLDGNPVKGCQALFEELESHTRAFAMRSQVEGWWRPPRKGERPPIKDLERGSWATVLSNVMAFLDIKACKKRCPLMEPGLIASARGVTDPRNLTSHRPRDLKAVIQRDKKLRTWFESSRDLLKSWYDATKPLKL